MTGDQAPARTSAVLNSQPGVQEEAEGGRSRCNLDSERKVDVVGCGNAIATEVDEDEDPDATDSEHSSSFSGSLVGSDDDDGVHSNYAEVRSQWMDGLTSNHGFRKKRLTAHWRKFIRPLMWRCHWIELRMNELRSQALRYEKELSKYQQQKELCSKMVESYGSVSRSVPIVSRPCKNVAMMRKKRKRKEDTVDISTFMSHHTIFSYYENKRAETDGHSVDDGYDDQVNDDNKGTDDLGATFESSFPGTRADGGALEEILSNIEFLKSRLINMKTHLRKITENFKEIPLTQCNFHVEQPIMISPCSSPQNNEELTMLGESKFYANHMFENEMEGHAMYGSAGSSYGDAADLDIVESTAGLFSAADIAPGPHDNDYFERENVDDILINNLAAGEELQEFEVSHAIIKPEYAVKEEAESSFEEESGLQKDELPAATEEEERKLVFKRAYSGKRRGRKPKRKRREA